LDSTSANPSAKTATPTSCLSRTSGCAASAWLPTVVCSIADAGRPVVSTCTPSALTSSKRTPPFDVESSASCTPAGFPRSGLSTSTSALERAAALVTRSARTSPSTFGPMIRASPSDARCASSWSALSFWSRRLSSSRGVTDR
jgi:hypothetical protein